MDITKEIDIHIGDNTHHQDHEIYPISLRIINAMVSKPTDPTPPVLDEDVELDILNTSYFS